jgi:hypothetical protein
VAQLLSATAEADVAPDAAAQADDEAEENTPA